MSPEQISDVLECGNPQQVWTVAIAYLEGRAQQSDDIGESLRRDAKDALKQADEHFAAAQEFHNLALAMRRAPITFAAQVDRSPEGRDAEERLDAKHESAVANGDAPKE
jgi:hypothetical protein